MGNPAVSLINSLCKTQHSLCEPSTVACLPEMCVSLFFFF